MEPVQKCPCCGILFGRKSGWAATIHCSRKCQRKLAALKRTYVCKECNSNYVAGPCQVKKNRRFCTLSCAKKHHYRALREAIPKDSDGRITLERAKQVLRLDVESGKIFWIHKQNSRVVAGQMAGALVSSGYRYVSIDGGKYLVHRIVFLLANGRWPDGQVDHINRVRNDNRPANLRDATRNQNLANMSLSVKNKSGIKGVSWHAKAKKWRATIGVNGKSVEIGCFHDKETAGYAYMSAALKIYGEFACSGEIHDQL